VNGRLLRRDELTAAEREAMLGLFCAHFAGVTPARFAADLAEKEWVLLLESDAGALRGFSTLLLYETVVPGEGVCSVVYSGDTIVDPEAWGSYALPRCWIGAIRQLREHYGRGRLWWLLLTSGFRTYRFLPVFWKEFWPHHAAPTLPYPQLRIDLLARERFGPHYHRDDGVVRFPEPQVLREAHAAVPEGRLADPHIAYFLARNPGWRAGDEMVCLTEIAEENLTPAGRRMWHAGRAPG
jgi:hypothetical protein